MKRTNPPAAGNAGWAVQPAIGPHSPGVPEPGRWVKSSMRRVFLPLLVAVGLVCSSCRTPLAPTSSEYFDIAEAVFRHLVEPARVDDPDSHGVNLAHKVYFLQLDS